LLAQIEAENNRLSKARKLLLDDTIDSGDYKTTKMECEKKAAYPGRQINRLQQANV
jgi:hypothetical protein